MLRYVLPLLPLLLPFGCTDVLHCPAAAATRLLHWCPVQLPPPPLQVLLVSGTTQLVAT